MPRRFSSPTDWVFHVQWLCHRLSMLDGRLGVPKSTEVIDLGRSLSALSATAKGARPGAMPQQMQWVAQLMARLGLHRAHWGRQPQRKALPMVGLHPLQGLCLVTKARASQTPWELETPLGRKKWSDEDEGWVFCSAALGWREQFQRGGLGLAKRVLVRHRGPFLWLLLVTLWVNAAIASIAWLLGEHFLQPMTGIDFQALSLLGLGGIICFGLIRMLDALRRSISKHVAEDLDTDLAREVFERLLKVRAEAHAPHAESLTTQVQLFESVRSFAHTVVTMVLLDIPFAVFFWAMILSMGGPELGVVALTYVLLRLAQGLSLCWRTRPSQSGDPRANQAPAKLMMMKTMAYAETVKSLDLRSVFLQRWVESTREQIKQNRGLQALTEVALHGRSGLRQLGFIVWLLVTLRLIEQGSGLSVGAWVGATLLLPRVLEPASSLPSLCVQWWQAKLALRGIDQIFKLQIDDEERSEALHDEMLLGQIMLHEVTYVHPDQLNDLQIGHWLVKPGERVAIVGDLGGGKSTLLKLMAGLYKPQQGHVRIDLRDVQEVPRDLLSKKVAYLPQNVQIFSGTLRDNLLAGLSQVSDT